MNTLNATERNQKESEIAFSNSSTMKRDLAQKTLPQPIYGILSISRRNILKKRDCP